MVESSGYRELKFFRHFCLRSHSQFATIFTFISDYCVFSFINRIPSLSRKKNQLPKMKKTNFKKLFSSTQGELISWEFVLGQMSQFLKYLLQRIKFIKMLRNAALQTMILPSSTNLVTIRELPGFFEWRQYKTINRTVLFRRKRWFWGCQQQSL